MVVLTELLPSSSSTYVLDHHHNLTYDYDVFLSFRSKDTRNDFTYHLYNALLDSGIITFLNDEEIETREPLKPELESAIRSSKASVIILSKNYASSTWCLDELVLILHQKSICKQYVIPIFYHVEPTHARKLHNSFKEAMADHKQKMEAETDAEKRSQFAKKMESWKMALTQVSDLKGRDAKGRQLFGDISKNITLQVYDVSVYASKIKNALAHKKVLLVLDDVDCLDQLDALLGNEAKSLQLLCIHAFKSNKPKEEYKEASEKLVKYCQGHPLALVVLGRSLQKRYVLYWEECIKALKKEPHSHVNNALKISLDALLFENDKELFKHIACFFVGIDRDVTETILNSCDLNSRYGITNLIEICLLSISWNKKLEMHSLIQEMGRDLVRQEESPDRPWERSRIWCYEESFKVLEEKQVHEKYSWPFS
ncbi:hypothetical protein R6Q59_023989 [Mikania micrantha]